MLNASGNPHMQPGVIKEFIAFRSVKRPYFPVPKYINEHTSMQTVHRQKTRSCKNVNVYGY
jgi:hypothetical protein